MNKDTKLIHGLDTAGFNELRLCRSGPMLYNKSDTYVGAALKKYGEYSYGEQELFTQIVKPGSIVIEVGANIGAHTVFLSKLIGATGCIFAFEPQRIIFQTLCANLALNQCTNAYTFHAALGAENGMIKVPDIDPAVPGNYGGLSLHNVENGQPVPLYALDQFSLPGCHFLKIDVEGMELEVLAGANDTINKARPVLYLENDRKERSQQLIARVMSFGYDLYWHLPPYFNPNNFAGDNENIFPNQVSVNMLCVPSEARFHLQGFRKLTSPDDDWRS